MSILRRIVNKVKRKFKRQPTPGTLHSMGVAGSPPVITTPWGPVSEGARLRAALNMREDLKKRVDVETLLANQLFEGDGVKGRAESRRRYPEGYEDQ